MEKNRKIRPEKLVDFRELYYDAFGYGDGKHELASEFFGVPVAECQRWHDDRPHPTAHRYLQVHCKGYLPYNTNWKDCRIRADGMVITPFGNCMPSDMALLHRRKWSAEQTRLQLVKYRQQLADLQTGSKATMALHTLDYLNRLMKELLTTD
ncbi:hypothetical protein [Rheinheimera sp.]|uniref:hypothetical protein n=1 Tax=Rheinheimera sp. TaxID=1869214 RepID=UPI003D2A4A12